MCVAARARGAAKLRGVAQTPVARCRIDQGFVLGRAGLGRLQAQGQQQLDRVGQFWVVQPAAQRVGTHVGQADTVLHQDVHQQLVALGRAADCAVGQVADLLLDSKGFSSHSADSASGEFKIDRKTPVVNPLIQMPKGELGTAFTQVPHG